ncbi:MAG: amidohydrolase family protein [Betaproteobacteria bacterium]|nr:amidohydrolase family protein [Betaproteobacteria bacterium]MDH3435430.1 amidohydrolase family protein [Betaproteobacteria bacterium]
MKFPEEKGPQQFVKGGTLIDGSGKKPIKDPVIELNGRRIKRVGTKASIRIPPRATVIDCGNNTLMPGMMDLHIHTAMYNCMTFHNHRVAQFEIMPHLQQMYSLFHAQNCFDMGFTTLRDLGMNGPYGLLVNELCAVRDAINAGIVEGPRMLVAGFTTMTGSHLDLIQPRAMHRWGFNTADGPWELRKLARKNMLAGCDVIKTCASGGGGTDKEEPDIRNLTQEELDALVDEAHALHKHAAVHCFTTQAQRMAIKAGTDTIEHMVFHDDKTIDLIAEVGVPVTPTLSHRTDHAIQLRREQGTAEFVLRKMKYLQPFCFQTFQKMYKAGVKIAMGTDMGFEPHMGTNGAELEIYVKLGMKPMDAILTATRNAAQALKMDKDLGTIVAGKLADIIAINGDPLKNIRCIQDKKNIQLVMKEGKIYADRRPGKNKNVVNVKPGEWKIVDYL